MYRHIGDPEGEAGSLLHLGDVQLAEGLSRAARRSWERSLALLSAIPGADVSQPTFRLCRPRWPTASLGGRWGLPRPPAAARAAAGRRPGRVPMML